MSTLAEIEEAADTLPMEEKEELVCFLTSRIHPPSHAISSLPKSLLGAWQGKVTFHEGWEEPLAAHAPFHKVKLLLDTHTFLRSVENSPRLSAGARAAIADVHIAAALEPLRVGERWGEEFVALRQAFAVGAVAGGAEKKAWHEFPGKPGIGSCRQS